MRIFWFCLLAALGGCTKTEHEEKFIYDPYGGSAYPNNRPKIVLPPGDVGLTSDNGSDTVTVLDLAGGSVIATAPIGRDPVDNDGPHHLAADRAGGFVYVALAYPAPTIALGPHAAHGSSQRAGYVQKLTLADLAPIGEVRVDPNPGDIVMSADAKRLVVSHFDLKKATNPTLSLEARRAAIAVIDVDQLLPAGSPDPRFISTCVAPHGVALSADGKTGYVACYGEDAIGVVDLEDAASEPEIIGVAGAPTTEGAPTFGPYAAVPSPSGALLAVSNTESKDVRFFDVASRAMTGKVVITEGAPYFAAWSADEKTIYVPTQIPDAVVKADAATGAVVANVPLDPAECELPHELVFGSDGTRLYLVCEGDHLKPSNVLELDPATLAVVRSFPVGVYPDRLAVMAPL